VYTSRTYKHAEKGLICFEKKNRRVPPNQKKKGKEPFMERSSARKGVAYGREYIHK
jgi:hypothetical protein